jgi:tetratricopeptide (TPR) repeat protein
LDEALDCFRDAVEYEDDAAGRAAIEYNQALAERQLGELRSASRTLQKRVKTLERAGAADQELALTLCDTAGALRELGEHAAALSLLDQAQAVLVPANLA